MTTFDYNAKTNKFTIKCDNFDELREHFSAANKNAKFLKRYNPFASSRFYAITPTGVFDVGLFNQIKEYLLSKHLTDIELTDSFKAKLIQPIPYVVQNVKNADYILRDYQVDALKIMLSYGRGIGLMGTGAGKTLTMAVLIENLVAKFSTHTTGIVVVPDIGLVEQTYNDFKLYNVNFTFTKWSGSYSLERGHNITIVNSANLIAKFDDNDWVKYADFLIVDEVHKIGKKNVINNLLSKIKTNHKFGFTGTLPTEPVDNWNVVGKFGPVVYEKSSADLRKDGYLTNAVIKAIEIDYNQKPEYVKSVTPTAKYYSEIDFIINNSFRNKVILKICQNFNNNTLILVNRLEHGRILLDLIQKQTTKKVIFISGEVETDVREQFKAEMEKNNNIICIAISKIFSTGINIKNIHMIIFASGGKSFIQIVQSIGRGLRLHENKQMLTIIDLVDNLEYSNEHFEERKKHYAAEKIKYNLTKIAETA